MIDASILNIIPPLIAAILTYIIASKRSRLQQARVLADMQEKAIDAVGKAEAKMREELWEELDDLRSENKTLRAEMSELRVQSRSLEELNKTMREEVIALRTTVDTYKEQHTQNQNKITELTQELTKNK